MFNDVYEVIRVTVGIVTEIHWEIQFFEIYTITQ